MDSAGITQSGSLYFTTPNTMVDIYVIGIDQGTGKIVTPQKKMIIPKQWKNYEPQYSPDGKFLAYIRMSPTGSLERSLCVFSLETRQERHFPLAVEARFPRWSPDNRFVYFSAFLSGSGMRMYRLDRQTGKYGVLLPDNAVDPANGNQFISCSSDGKSYYFTYWEGNTRTCQILVRNAEGITHKLFEAKDGYSWEAAVSPDGSRLVAVSRAVHREITILPTSGNGPSKVLYQFDQEGEHPAWLVWTPDGKSIIFTKRNNDREWGLWRISAEGGEPQNLGISTQWISGISIHPDGKQLAFSSVVPGTSSKELWVLDNF